VRETGKWRGNGRVRKDRYGEERAFGKKGEWRGEDVERDSEERKKQRLLDEIFSRVFPNFIQPNRFT
jgi:hypothetical protein